MSLFLSAKTKILKCLFIVILLVSCILLYKCLNVEPETIVIKASYSIDINDDSEVKNFAENIFIGEIINQESIKEIENIPETQYNVEIIQNIKGTLDGTILVNQQGGYDEETLYIMENDEMLEVGKQYFLATRYNEDEEFYTLIPVVGDQKINSDNEIEEFEERFE